MTADEVKKRLKDNWVGIVCTMVSIIQGLAFNNLVLLFPPIFANLESTGSWLMISYFFLSLIILFRITQTYITAALAYSEWKVNLEDIFIIFLLGFIEFFVFSTLDTKIFNVIVYYERLSIITVFAVISYSLAFRKLKKTGNKNYRLQRNLQFVNIFGVFIPFLISFFIIIGPVQCESVYVILSDIISVILLFNIYHSLKVTFGDKNQYIPSGRKLRKKQSWDKYPERLRKFYNR